MNTIAAVYRPLFQFGRLTCAESCTAASDFCFFSASSVLPAAAGGFGSPPSTGYFQTADGLAAGIDAVNGDATHNFFFEPGTGGVSSAYKVFERLKDSTALGTAETIGCTGCTVAIITGGTPEPASITR